MCLRSPFSDTGISVLPDVTDPEPTWLLSPVFGDRNFQCCSGYENGEIICLGDQERGLRQNGTGKGVEGICRNHQAYSQECDDPSNDITRY